MLEIRPLLPDIWLFIIGFFLLYYAIADGFDLGVGILSLFARDESERGLMMTTLESIWHDNQTWLVLLGGMLFGAFPLFYGILLSSLYIPILAMLFGLILRGVAFEFRENAQQKQVWSMAFGLGSLIATLAQGFALGGLLGGLAIDNGCFAGGVWDWLNPFSFLITAGVLFGYVMLGSNYLILKTSNDIQKKSFRYAWIASIITMLVSVVVHFSVIDKYPHAAHKWITIRATGAYGITAFPLLALAASAMLLRSLWKKREVAPLIWNALLILLSFAGLSVSLYPVMIPNLVSADVTVQAAAASPRTLLFMLVVTAILLPIILTYTYFKHRIFRGKVREEAYGGAE